MELEEKVKEQESAFSAKDRTIVLLGATKIPTETKRFVVVKRTATRMPTVDELDMGVDRISQKWKCWTNKERSQRNPIQGEFRLHKFS